MRDDEATAAEIPPPRRWRYSRAVVVFAHDLVMAAVAFIAAVALRYGPDAFTVARDVLLVGTPIFVGVAAVVFKATGLYRGIWRYASLDDILAILRAATLVVPITVLVLFLITRGADLPRTSMLLAWVNLVVALAAPRFAYRILKDRHLRNLLRRSDEARRIPVLLVGAGDETDHFIREMARDSDALYRPVGIIDDKGKRRGQSIRGVPILGGIDDIPAVVEDLGDRHVRPQRIIAARDRISADAMRRLLDLSESLALPLARAPRVTDFRRPGERAFEAKPIDLEDLLNRPQANLDRAAVERLIRGKRVVVTGAGGSIGSELVRQVAAIGPAELTLIDFGEFNLYAIDLEMGKRWPHLSRRTVLADVRDRDRLAQAMTAARPDIVLHAAALKHVPMAEDNVEEYVLTNIVGTRQVEETARAAGAKLFVMVSTDKAVNPTNVMGATKRAAEMWCQATDLATADDDFRCVTVRFGNVLGSAGSVAPLFQKQLAEGGPLTVTHPDITRYFMTIREAVELILQAAACGAGDGVEKGRIFVLDMGEPVKIVDLARQVIRLAGLKPDIDVQIAFTGLRPGEKLHEELFHHREALTPAPLAGLLLAAPRAADVAALAAELEALAVAARARQPGETLAQLRRLIPEFAAAADEAKRQQGQA